MGRGRRDSRSGWPTRRTGRPTANSTRWGRAGDGKECTSLSCAIVTGAPVNILITATWRRTTCKLSSNSAAHRKTPAARPRPWRLSMWRF